MPGVRAVYTGADLADLWAAPMPCAWAVTEDMLNPPHSPDRHRRGPLRRRRRGGACSPTATRSPTTPSRRSTSSTTRVNRSSTSKMPSPTASLVHPDLGTNSAYTWNLLVEETDGAVQQAFDDAAYTVSERYVQQRLIPMAMEPRAVVVDPPAVRRRRHAVHVDADPPRPQGDGCRHARRARAPVARGRPGRRRRLRRQARRVRRGAAVRRAVTQARRAGALERDPLGEHRRHHPGARPDPAHRARRRLQRQADRRSGPPHRRHGRLPAADHAGHPDPRGLPVRRCVRPAEGVRLLVHRRVHQPHPDRRLPRRRAPRGDVRHRAGHGLARRCSGRRPARAPTSQLHPQGPVPVRGVHRARLRLGRPRCSRHHRRRHDRLRRACEPARPTQNVEGATKRLGLGDLQLLRDVRPRAVAGARLAQLLGRRLGGGDRPHPADRQGAGRHRHVAPRPGPRDLVVDDRRRQARHRSRRRRRPALRHRHRPARHGHLRLALAARRRRRHRRWRATR